ncbi:hypothetical protein NE865_02146 [Phthorimaea operculella]|nr:hypothetical protein NE865_02146 [Phthorimaea operculella]
MLNQDLHDLILPAPFHHRTPVIFDPVCGLVISDNGVHIVQYQNLCTLWLTRCKSSNIKEIKQVSSKLCGFKKQKTILSNGRREADFSIVGANQACNHSCPTYCTDIYDPVCGNIIQNINREDESGEVQLLKKTLKQTFVNHCHADLYSCATGTNGMLVVCIRYSRSSMVMCQQKWPVMLNNFCYEAIFVSHIHSLAMLLVPSIRYS